MAALDSWGSNLSLVGSLETMRIDIVVSEYGKLPETGMKTKSFKNKSKSGIYQRAQIVLLLNIFNNIVCYRKSVVRFITRSSCIFM